MQKFYKRLLSMGLCLTMMFGTFPVNSIYAQDVSSTNNLIQNPGFETKSNLGEENEKNSLYNPWGNGGHTFYYTGDAHTGNACARIFRGESNWRNGPNYPSNENPQMNFLNGRTYYISFWGKRAAEGTSTLRMYVNQSGLTVNGINSPTMVSGEVTNEWTQVSGYYTFENVVNAAGNPASYDAAKITIAHEKQDEAIDGQYCDYYLDDVVVELLTTAEILVEGDEKVYIPLPSDSLEKEYAFAARCLNQFGEESGLEAEAVVWTLAEPVTGVRVDSATGVVYVSNQAEEGSFTLVATSSLNPSVVQTKEIQLQNMEPQSEDSKPVATNVVITGKVIAGRTITADYLYSDANGDIENGSTYCWQIADAQDGEYVTVAENTKEYSILETDVNKWIRFSVTPKNLAEAEPVGDTAFSEPVQVVADTAPVVQEQALSGSGKVQTVLTGSYTYYDKDEDAEAGTSFQWYVSEDNQQWKKIEGAVEKEYTVSQDDLGKYLRWGITPKNEYATGEEAFTDSVQVAQGNWSYYVDPENGNDSNSGQSADQALKSIEKAMELVSANQSQQEADITVYLKGGSYELNKPLEFGSEHSGKGDYTVTWKPYPDEEVTVTGGKTVTEWEKVEGTNYYQASVSEAAGYPDYFRQIWVNGVRRMPAKSDFIQPSRMVLYDDPATEEVRDGFYVYTEDLKSSYTNLSDMRLFQEGNFKHVELAIKKIKPINDTESVIIPSDVSSFMSWTQTAISFQNKNTLQLLNAKEELDQPGEFYLDRATDTLYYYPQDGEDLANAEVVVPNSESLLEIDGASNLIFDGIQFTYSNWTYPRDNEIGRSQADTTADYISIDGQINVQNSQNVTFRNCELLYSAHAGIYFYKNNQNCLVEGNVFKDLTAAAVIVGDSKSNNKVADLNTGITISNNVIRNIGQDYYQSSGIYANYSKDLLITHNDVSDVAYFGINQRYGDSKLTSAATGVYGNTEISYNKVTNYGSGAKIGFGYGDEVAAYYFYGVNDSVIKNNYASVNGVSEKLEGVFRQDQYGYNNLFENNVAENAWAARSFSNYTASTLSGIVFRNCYADKNTEFSGTESQVKTENIVVKAPEEAWPAEAQKIIDEAGLESEYKYLLQEVDAGTNLAQDKTVTASSGNDAQMIADGNNDTFYKEQNETGNSWVQLDLGAMYNLSKIRVNGVNGDNDPDIRRNYQVQVSNDPEFSTYLVVGGQNEVPHPYNGAMYGKDMVAVCYNGADYYMNAEGGYRYVRVVGAELGISELRVFGYPTDVAGTETENSLPQWDTAEWPMPEEREYDVSLTANGEELDWFEDTQYWFFSNTSCSLTQEDDFLIMKTPNGSVGGYTMYEGKIFGEGLMKFQLKNTENEAGAWNTVFFRSQNRAECYNGSYMIMYSSAGIELHRFNGGQKDRTILYGYMDGYETKLGPAVTTVDLNDGQAHDIELYTANVENGVRIIVNIDGKQIFDCVDSIEGYIESPGFFGLHARNGVVGFGPETETYGSAAYSNVDSAVEKANALDKTLYANFSAVEEAINEVVRGLDITKQAEVEVMAEAIEAAIAALEYKGADYSKVEAAIQKVSALNKANYVDFAKVEQAVNAVINGLDITKQAEVDAMAEAIESAIAALEYKGADYSKVEAAIQKANALNKADYVDFAKVEQAVNAVVNGLDITKQAEVDAMAKAIEDAIAALQEKSPAAPDNGNSGNAQTNPGSSSQAGNSAEKDKDNSASEQTKPDSSSQAESSATTDKEPSASEQTKPESSSQAEDSAATDNEEDNASEAVSSAEEQGLNPVVWVVGVAIIALLALAIAYGLKKKQ